jgi:hypothetical protein
LMLDPQGTDADAEPSAVNTAREWSDAELTELGNMLVRGLSMGRSRDFCAGITAMSKTRSWR